MCYCVSWISRDLNLRVSLRMLSRLGMSIRHPLSSHPCSRCRSSGRIASDVQHGFHRRVLGIYLDLTSARFMAYNGANLKHTANSFITGNLNMDSLKGDDFEICYSQLAFSLSLSWVDLPFPQTAINRSLSVKDSQHLFHARLIDSGSVVVAANGGSGRTRSSLSWLDGGIQSGVVDVLDITVFSNSSSTPSSPESSAQVAVSSASKSRGRKKAF